MDSICFTFLLILLVVLPLPLITTQNLSSSKCSVKGDAWRFDCFPQGSLTEGECLARGCCWSPSFQKPVSRKEGQVVPLCFYPTNYTTYTVVSVKEYAREVQINATLRRPSPYGIDVKMLSVDIIKKSDTLMRIRIKDAENERWEPPSLKFRSKTNSPFQHPPPKFHSPRLEVKWADIGKSFGFTVYSNDGNTLLQTIGALIFSEQLLQISFLLPSHTIYGLGQHQGKIQLNTSWSKYTLWNHDGHNVVDKINLYGSHPFYLCKSGESWYGFFLHNSNAMDVILQPAPAITLRPIGGIFDMYIFIGRAPSDVIAQYHFLVGLPSMPPYWALGFQLCAQEYGSAQKTLDVVKRMRKWQIPQDVQWNDIEYGQKNRVFTNDKKSFGDQSILVDTIHDYGMHYVMMADCGISNTAPPGSYAPYDMGKKMDLFIKDAHGKALIGRVWPGTTVWPDFLDPQSQKYWAQLISDYHQRVQFDGLWLDMNEISNFVNGSIYGCSYNSSLDYPPYLPGVHGGSLCSHTICPSAKHKISSHYNVHNLYSLYETMTTYVAIRAVRGKRPFLISRSSFPGLGHYGGTWSGDNKSSWYDMYKSISAMLHMNMYGIPMTGSDICGFYGNATEELCTRWLQLGAFYSFSRNHHSVGTKAQDPTVFSTASLNSTRKALLTRYSLLPYLYTLMWFSHTQGQTVIRPLFFEFPEDEKTLNLDSQFLWGSGLMVSPVLKQGERSIWAYFPEAVWYDFYSGQKPKKSGCYIKLPAALDVINLHIRGGSILVTQDPAQTTQESRRLPFGLIVALDSNGSALGHHYFDDGDSLTENQNHHYNLLSYSVQKNSLHSHWITLGYQSESMVLGNVTIFGLTFHPSQVTLNEKPVSFEFKNAVLYITSIKFDLQKEHLHMEWKT